MKKSKMINEGGINGLGIGLIDTNSHEFRELRLIINKISNDQPEKTKLENQLLSIRFQMEEYLNKNDPDEIIEAGQFVKDFLNVLKIKSKKFAEYIEYEESNLSALYKGRRRINSDLAMKFGKVFKVDPAIWLHIQSKNDLIEVSKKEKKYESYKIEDLLKEAS